MYERTSGPWHEGFAVTCEVLGTYVTIVAGRPDVAEAVAELVASGGVYGPPAPAMVGRLNTVSTPQPRKRIL